MNSLREKVAIVTGGGSGIGRGIALSLAREGVYVVVCGRRIDRLENTVSTIQEFFSEAIAVSADISIIEDVERLVKTANEKYGRVDILVNNAGIHASAEIHMLDVESWDRIFGTNLRGSFLLTRHILPIMRAQQSGHIINISSESGLEYYTGDTAYGTSKHALNAFGEYIQRENQGLNIRVNTICPGMVVTDMTENSPGLDQNKCLYPEDIAELVIWLLTRRPNIKIGTPILIQTMQNPWE